MASASLLFSTDTAYGGDCKRERERERNRPRENSIYNTTHPFSCADKQNLFEKFMVGICM